MSPSSPFKVHLTPDAQQSVRILILRALRRGGYDRLLRALKAIQESLRSEPTSWGDPCGRLRGLDMVVYRRIHDRIQIVYAVHNSESLVWVYSISPVLDHPLASDSQAT
jgi:hypothetical protein